MAANNSYVKVSALPPVPKGFSGDPEVWRFMEALRQRVGGDSGDLIYNAAYDASQSAASLEPLVYAVAQEVQTQLEGQIRAIIEDAQTDRIDTSSADNNATPLPNPDQFSFDDFPVGGLIQQAIDSAPVQSVFGRIGDVVAVEGDYALTLLDDVTITAPSSNQILSYNGTIWVNSGVPAGSIAGIIPVTNGGTGASNLTANNIILGNGTSPVAFVAPGSSGNILKSNGTTWVSAAAPSVAPSYQEFVSTAAQTIFNTTINTTAKAAGKAYLQVYVSGVFQQEGAAKQFTVTGANQITFNVGLAVGLDVVMYSYS